MGLKADDFLEPILPFLGDALVSPASVAAIRALARQLPMAPLGGFECRLGNTAPDADFALYYVPAVHGVGAPSLSGDRDQAAIDTYNFTDPGWKQIQELFRAASDPASPLCARLRGIWLEFDMPRAGSGVPLPGVFFNLNSPHQAQESLTYGFQLLTGSSWPPSLTVNLARCFAALPSSAHIAHAGLMLSRRASGARLVINGLAPEAIPAYLQAIGWTGPGAEVAEVLAMLSGFTNEIALDIDVDQGVGSQIGLECYLDDPRRARVVSVWPSFLEHLVQRGLCLPEKRDALLAWPGYSCRHVFGIRLFQRGLNHIKIVYQPSQPLKAKAYLIFWNGWTQARLTQGEGKDEQPTGMPLP